MRFEFKNSFGRSLKSLHSLQREEDAKNVVKRFVLVLEHKNSLAYGFGLKKLKSNYFEIRSGIEDRVLFRRQSDLIEFIFVGNHDDIRRFLDRL